MAYPVGAALNIEGIPELRRAFKRAAERGIPASLKATNKAIGDDVIRRVRPRLPVQDGTYAASLRAGNTSWKAVVRAGGKRRAPYAPIIHWGSAYRPTMPPRPQIAETAIEMADEIERAYVRGLQRELRRISAF